MPQAERTDPTLRLVVWTVLYCLAGGVALLPIVDPDVWWHLRAGQWIAEHGSLPTTDPFSRHPLPWQAYSWLFELLAYALHQHGGLHGIFLGRCVLTLAVVAALHRLIAKRLPLGRDSFVLSAGLLAVAILALLPLVKERPWLFTILFGTLTLDVILDERAGRRTWGLWLLPLLFALWANLHIQFIHALLLLGLATVAPLIDHVLASGVREPPEGASSGGLRPGLAESLRFGLATALCVLATLATPYHVQLYLLVREYAAARVGPHHVSEMQAMGFRAAWDWCALALFALAVFALARRPFSAFDVLLLLVGAAFGFRTCRDVWLLVLASLAVIAPAPPEPGRPTAFLPTRRQAALLPLFVIPLLGLVWWRVTTGDGFRATLKAMYPVASVEYVRERRLDGPLFNSYSWGGYLMWELPDLPVSVDGRANIYGDALLANAFNTWGGKPGWRDDPDLESARLVVLEIDAPLTALLRIDGRFEVAHEDGVAVVFVRKE